METHDHDAAATTSSTNSGSQLLTFQDDQGRHRESLILEENSQHRPSIQTLPFELFCAITSYLFRRDLRNLCLVSRKTYHLSMPCLYRTIYLYNENLEYFLGGWNTGHITRRSLQYVQKFGIQYYDLFTKQSTDAQSGTLVEERHPWKYLVGLLKSREMVALREVEVDAGGYCGDIIALDDIQSTEEVLRQLVHELPQNIALSISAGASTFWRQLLGTPQEEQNLDYTPGLNVLRILSKTCPIVSLEITLNWDDGPAFTSLLINHPAVFHHHLRTLEIRFDTRPTSSTLHLLMSKEEILAKIAQVFTIPNQLVRLETLHLHRTADFWSLPENLTLFAWKSNMPRTLLSLHHNPSPNNEVFVNAWRAIARLRHLKRLEIRGVFDYRFPPTLTPSVEFTGLETFIVNWHWSWKLGLEYTSRMDFPDIRNLPEESSICSMTSAVISNNPRLKIVRINGLSGPSLRTLGTYGNLEMLEILDHFPYLNGVFPLRDRIVDDDFLALTACKKLHYLRFRRVLPLPILSQLVEACQFHPPLIQKPGFNWRDYGIYLAVGPLTYPPSPVSYYQDPQTFRGRLGPEWVDLPTLEERENPGGIEGEMDGFSDGDRDDVCLELDAVM